MTSVKITIKEYPGKGVAVDMEPHTVNVTPSETVVATIIDVFLKDATEFYAKLMGGDYSAVEAVESNESFRAAVIALKAKWEKEGT